MTVNRGQTCGRFLNFFLVLVIVSPIVLAFVIMQKQILLLNRESTNATMEIAGLRADLLQSRKQVETKEAQIEQEQKKNEEIHRLRGMYAQSRGLVEENEKLRNMLYSLSTNRIADSQLPDLSLNTDRVDPTGYVDPAASIPFEIGAKTNQDLFPDVNGLIDFIESGKAAGISPKELEKRFRIHPDNPLVVNLMQLRQLTKYQAEGEVSKP
jgi:hypothetical protein